MDRVFGEPSAEIHPTVWMGTLIDFLKKKPFRDATTNLFYGILVFWIIALPFAAATYLILISVGRIPEILLGAIILKVTFSWKASAEHTTPILDAIDKGDLPSARKVLSRIVGRNTEELDKEEIISGTVESIGEGSVDGIISPLFYYIAFGILFGIPAGLASSIFFRATNTLDSMIGYGRYGEMGSFSAKMDDLLNLVPARIAALFIVFSAYILGYDWRNSAGVLKRDRKRTPSPNSGHPISALAGALRVRLEKVGFYTIGDEIERLNSGHILKAHRIVDLAVSLFILFSLTAIIGVKLWM